MTSELAANTTSRTPTSFAEAFPAKTFPALAEMRALALLESARDSGISSLVSSRSSALLGFFAENVASGAHLWVDAVVRGLEEQGYDCLPVPFSAADVGAAHERARVFVIGRHPDRDVQPMVQEHEEMARLSRVAGGFPDWTVDPGIRVADGVSSRMGALGNAAVPQMVEVVGHMILKLEKERRAS